MKEGEAQSTFGRKLFVTVQYIAPKNCRIIFELPVNIVFR